MKTFWGVLLAALLVGATIVGLVVGAAMLIEKTDEPVTRMVTPLKGEQIPNTLTGQDAPDEPDDGGPTSKLPRYDDLREAAVEAARRLYQCSHYYECGGIIAQDPKGKYVIGPNMVTLDHGDEVNVPHGVPIGWKFVAEFHSHPCLPVTHEVSFFSPNDTSNYLENKIVGYMLDQCTGEVHEFVPGRDSPNDTEMLPGNPGSWSTHGRVIGKIEVDGLSVEAVTRPE